MRIVPPHIFRINDTTRVAEDAHASRIVHASREVHAHDQAHAPDVASATHTVHVQGTTSRARVTALAVRTLRMILAFMLAFGVTFWVQGLQAVDSYADDGSQNSADDSMQDSESSLHIIEIGVFEEGTTRDAFAYASEGSASQEVRAVIERKTGQIDFDAAIQWDDGSDWEYDTDKVNWSIDEASTSIAHISPSGVLEAAGTDNGIVTVTAWVDGSYTVDGEDLQCIFQVELRGQTDTKYVTRIRICDDEGNPIDSSYKFEAGTLSTAMLELTARVTVYDPAQDGEIEYLVTPAEGLAAQSDGELADLIWDSADTRLGTVSEEGIYRPAVAAVNEVYCVSAAGFNGSRISAQATINMPPDPGKEAVNGYHPQNTLTIKVYYEDYPDQLVKEVTYSVEDLEAMNPVIRTYTALRGKLGYMTTTGRGPLLSTVLKKAGVNTDGVARLRFGTPDNYQGVVSWDLLVDSDRFYFPNIDIGSYSEAQQVPPMIAIDAFRNVGSDVSVHTDDLSDTRRFLLLFGAKKTGETTTNLQVYNIHTLYVDLEGSPPSKDGKSVTVQFVDSVSGKVLKSVTTIDPESVSAPEAPVHKGRTFKGWNKKEDSKGNVTYTTVYESSDSGNGASKDNDPNNNGEGTDAGGDKTGDSNAGKRAQAGGGTADLRRASDGGATSGGAASNAGDSPAQEVTDVSVTALDPSQVQSITPGKWSVLQAINKHPSNVDDLMLNNPFAPFAGPVFAGVLAAGALECGLVFWRQKRRPRFAV